MDAEAKRAALNAEIEKHMKASSEAFEDTDPITGLKEKIEAERLRTELLELREAPLRHGHVDVNALQRIGAYVSPAQSTVMHAMQTIVHHVATIAKNTEHNRTHGIGGF